jgi:AGZA family xanthine/uracil permease-like MFS transporter
MRRVLLVDSAAAAGGGAMGVSSVTTYVESGAGVGAGARTGLAAVVTGLLFALAIFFVPVIELVGQGVGKAGLHPTIAPALIMVGALMTRLVQGIDWGRTEDAIPAFLVIAGIPLTFSIAAGIGLGVIGYVIVMLAKGRGRDVHVLMWVLVPLFLAYYSEDWLSANVF